MNRRDFCQTAGLLMAAPVFGFDHAWGREVPLRSETHPQDFRARKVFLEAWNAEFVRKHSLIAASFVRHQMLALRREGCNALILMPKRGSAAGWMHHITSEADRFGLAVLVPAQWPRTFLCEVQTVIPLMQDAGILQSTNGQVTDNGGFLLLNGQDSVCGLVLYDSSRCLWTGFTSSAVAHVRDAEWCDHDSQLAAARWIDLTRQSFFRNLV